MQWSSLKNFDEVSNTDTGGMVSLTGLNITSPNLDFGEQYQGINPTAFFEAVESVPVDRKEWTFVDLGCGKGRAILLASLLSFKEIIGVEFSPTLAAIARENLTRFAGSQQQDCQVSIIDADAADYRFSSNKIFLYLFNPFTAPVMDRVIANLVYACEHRSAEAIVVYVLPFCHEQFLRSNAFEVITLAPIKQITHRNVPQWLHGFACYRFRGASAAGPGGSRA